MRRTAVRRCEQEGCERPHLAKGLCRNHYQIHVYMPKNRDKVNKRRRDKRAGIQPDLLPSQPGRELSTSGKIVRNHLIFLRFIAGTEPLLPGWDELDQVLTDDDYFMP